METWRKIPWSALGGSGSDKDHGSKEVQLIRMKSVQTKPAKTLSWPFLHEDYSMKGRMVE